MANNTIKEENEDFEQSHILPQPSSIKKDQPKSIEPVDVEESQEYKFIQEQIEVSNSGMGRSFSHAMPKQGAKFLNQQTQ